MIEQQLQSFIYQSIQTVFLNKDKNVDLNIDININSIRIERPRQKSHGDFSSNIAMMLAKPLKSSPRDIAENLIAEMNANLKINSDSEYNQIIENITLAGPGFINFILKSDAEHQIISTVLSQKNQFGSSLLSNPSTSKINLEFVSANPTGPLHVGHGRGAAYGSALANVLRFSGLIVDTEYYVNDAGRQMDILAVSVYLRYLQVSISSNQTNQTNQANQTSQKHFKFPSNAYQGDYVKCMGQEIFDQQGQKFKLDSQLIFNHTADDYCPERQTGDKERHIDDVISNIKKYLGEENYHFFHQYGLDSVLSGIQTDLKQFGVEYTQWFSEKNLHTSGDIEKAVNLLQSKHLLYKQNGATWFKASELGDEKDRVLIRDNGQPTYFAADAAYLLNKFNRGYDKIIYIFGADHHGYIPRLKALAQAFDIDSNKIIIPLVQFAVLYRNGKQVQMSSRSGEFVTLKELCEDVGVDAARYFYIMRKVEQHLDFDLDLAKKQSNDNPVYYIQYAHARICSVFRQLDLKYPEWAFNRDAQSEGLKNLNVLTGEHELNLVKRIAQFKNTINQAAHKLEPHLIAYYLKDLAADFHGYYNSQQFLVSDSKLRNARLALIAAVRIVLQNGLYLLGLSSPEQM